MGTTPFLNTTQKDKQTYASFIARDNRKRLPQILAMLALRDLGESYQSNGVLDSINSEWNNFSKKNSVDWAFELYMMKRAILSERPHSFSNTPPYFTRQANDVFLLAMVNGHAQIVSFFLSNKLLHINQSIFGSQYWPSYYLLSCACAPAVSEEFRKFWGNPQIRWNGLSPNILSAMAGNPLIPNFYMDFITYQQYALIQRFLGYDVIMPPKSSTGPGLSAEDMGKTLFLLDLVCMRSDKVLIREILENSPEAGAMSHFSFLLQSREHLILILSRYGFRTDQKFNGHTPLHIACHNSDFCTLSILLYLGFPIVKDHNGKYPNEIGSHKMREMCSIFFNICTTVPAVVGGIEQRKFSKDLFREHMVLWMKLLKYNPNEFDKYRGIFRYLDFNISNQILRRSRFNITGIFSSARSAVSIEQCVRWFMKHPVPLRTRSPSEALIMYSRYFG